MFFYPLNQNLFFMGFDSKEEADWVMENGSRICRGEALILERWTPSTGCTGSKSQNQEAWIRVVGLPLHLWTEEIIVTIGDSCGGFVAMDKDTSLMKNLLWARILVKMKSSGRPTSVNLLAGARSYEIQIWWEIQPRVMEVYPRIFSRETELENPRVEDEGMIRAGGRVNAERGARRHIPRVAQRELGQWQALHKGGTEGILCQKLKLGGITREGTISHCGIQKITGERRREEGSTSSNDVLGCTLGFSHGDAVGQSPGMIQIAVGQSPRNETPAVRPNNFSHLEKQKSDLAGKLGETERGSNPNLAKLQNPDASGVGKVVGKQMLSTQNQGRGNEYTATGVEFGTGRVSTRDARGDQIGEKESFHHDLGRGLQYGKVTRNALISVVSKSRGKVGDSPGREEGDSVGGDKSRNSCFLPTKGFGRFNFAMGKVIKAHPNPNSREGTSSPTKSEAEEGGILQEEGGTVIPGTERRGDVDGRLPMVLSKEKRIYPAQQEKKMIGSGQVSYTGRGASLGEGSVLELGRFQDLEAGQPNRTSQGLNPNVGSFLQNMGNCGPNCSEAEQRGAGLTQEMQQLRSPPQQFHKCSLSDRVKGHVRYRGEYGENREEYCQESDCPNTHRYDDNSYEQSPSALISVFGRSLLPGDISGLGESNGEEDLEPLRVVAADGRELGVNFSGALMEDGEGLVTDDRKSNEVHNEVSELWTYESWEKSCLARFSNFLGFPTKGFEREITKLLRNLVNAQKLGKGKECQVMSKSERELKKLTWTINYKGKEISREDGRDKGKLLIKLK